MAVVSMLNVSILILSLNVIVTLQAPVRNQFTCLPRKGSKYNFDYRKSDWNSSCRTDGENPLRYNNTAMQSHIGHTLSLPHFQLSNDE